MKLNFEKAEWIWENGAPSPDEYAEFKCAFLADGDKTASLEISADSDYTVYINGALAAFAFELGVKDGGALLDVFL